MILQFPCSYRDCLFCFLIYQFWRTTDILTTCSKKILWFQILWINSIKFNVNEFLQNSEINHRLWFIVQDMNSKLIISVFQLSFFYIEADYTSKILDSFQSNIFFVKLILFKNNKKIRFISVKNHYFLNQNHLKWSILVISQFFDRIFLNDFILYSWKRAL